MQPNPEVNKLRGMGPVVTGSSQHTGKQENKLSTHAAFFSLSMNGVKLAGKNFMRGWESSTKKVKVSVGIMTRELYAWDKFVVNLVALSSIVIW